MKNPVVYGTGLWVLGYCAAIKIPHVSVHWLLIVFIALMMLGLWVFAVPGRSGASLVLLTLLSFGYYSWVDQHNLSRIAADNLDPNGTEVRIQGEIVSPVEVDGDKVSFVLAVERLSLSEQLAPLSTKSNPIDKLLEHMQISVRLLQQEEQAKALEWQRGDSVALHGELRQPSVARNFGGFDYRAYLRLQRIFWIVTVKGTEEVVVKSDFRWDLQRLLRWNDQFRGFLGAKIDRMYPPDQAGYMKSMLLGLRVDMDPLQFQQFSQLGLTHILAISGLQVAVFVTVLMWILRKLGLTREANLVTVLSLLPFYILLTGASPSVIRAGLMGMLALFAARMHWLKDGINFVCLVGLAMLLWNPYYIVDVGFQLSFLVTIGLIIMVPHVVRLLPIRAKMLQSALAVTFVAQWISFPLSIYYFNQFSLISWLANLLLVPFISFVVTPLGSAALVIGTASITIGKWIAWLVIQCNHFTFGIVNVIDQWRWFHLLWPTPPLWWLFVYYLLTGVILWSLLQWRKQRQYMVKGILLYPQQEPTVKKSIFLASMCAFGLLLGYGYVPDWLTTEDGKVQFIDVGQGDCILVHTPDDRNILIDGGGTLVFTKRGEEWKKRKSPYEVGKKLLVPLLKQRGVHRLDYIIMTQEDADHVGGLQAVLEQIPVEKIWFNGTLKTNAGIEKLFHTALEKQITLLVAKAGLDVELGTRTRIQFISSVSTPSNQISVNNKQNNASLVFLLQMNQTRFLFTGDIEKEAEKKLLAQQELLQTITKFEPIDVLKVAHHGSKTSSTAEWLDYWHPKQAVISVGERNFYGHPSLQVLERLTERDTDIFRTDQQGEIQMLIKKDGMDVQSKLGK